MLESLPDCLLVNILAFSPEGNQERFLCQEPFLESIQVQEALLKKLVILGQQRVKGGQEEV